MPRPVNYYPPLKVANTVSDDIIKRSLFNLCRHTEVVDKIEDNGEFKTVHLDTKEELDWLEDTLWVILDRLERDGSIIIFKSDDDLTLRDDKYGYEDGWVVDGLSADETYEKHYAYTVSYLDNNVKGIRLGGLDDPNTYDSDPEPVPEPVSEPPKKRCWFVRLFCRV